MKPEDIMKSENMKIAGNIVQKPLMRKIKRIIEKSSMIPTEDMRRRTLEMIKMVFKPTKAEWELIKKEIPYNKDPR